MTTFDFSHIFFDADNTLFDFDGSSKLAFRDLVNHLNLQDWKDHYQKYQVWNHQVWDEFEKGVIDSVELRSKRFRLYFKEIGMDFDPNEANDLYLNFLVDHATLYPESLEMLNELKQAGKHLFILTNGLKEVQKPRIRKKEITHLFDAIIVSDEIGVAKPNVGFFEVAYDAAEQPPKEKIIMIGDSLKSDIAGGNNFGIFTCWFNPKGKTNDGNVTPDKEVHSLTEMKNFLL